jgi:aspartyl aminopeptidase
MTTRPSPATSVIDDLFAFIDSSPSPFHAVESSARMLANVGFTEVQETARLDDSAGRHYIKRGGALIAWVKGDRTDAAAPFRLIGAHTDSPNLRIKPQPDTSVVGYHQAGVEIYGGALLNSWLDRDLGISGRLILNTNGADEVALVKIDRPLLRVAQLAIHLDRDVNEGLKLDRQTQLSPIWAQTDTSKTSLIAHVASEAGVEPAAVVAFDLMAHDTTPCATFGASGEFYAAPRIDNLASCHAAVSAIMTAQPNDEYTSVISLFDHEEVGSSSNTGADGAFLPDVLERIVIAGGGDRECLLRSIAASWCVSADGAHAVHPNYLDRYEPDHHVFLNGGPVVKVNNNVRYATDGLGLAMFRRVCESVGVPMQSYVHRTNLTCGSTIGPLTAANLGMRTVDVGSAQLSMHSAREMGGADDPALLTTALSAFLTTE